MLLFLILAVLGALLGAGGWALTAGRRGRGAVALVGLCLPTLMALYPLALLRLQDAGEVRLGRRAAGMDETLTGLFMRLLVHLQAEHLPLGGGYFAVGEGFQDVATHLYGPTLNDHRGPILRLGCAGPQVALRLWATEGEAFALLDPRAGRLRSFSTQAALQRAGGGPLAWGRGPDDWSEATFSGDFPVGLTLPAPCAPPAPASDALGRIIGATRQPAWFWGPPLLAPGLYLLWAVRVRRSPRRRSARP